MPNKQRPTRAGKLIVPPTKIELVRRIACLADNQIMTVFTDEMNIVGVAGNCGSGSKFIVASLSLHCPPCYSCTNPNQSQYAPQFHPHNENIFADHPQFYLLENKRLTEYIRLMSAISGNSSAKIRPESGDSLSENRRIR
jgi:hypothetical protein